MRNGCPRPGQQRGHVGLVPGEGDHIGKVVVAAAQRTDHVQVAAAVSMSGPGGRLAGAELPQPARWQWQPRFRQTGGHGRDRLLRLLRGGAAACLMVDRQSGRAVSSVTWDSRQAMEASRDAASRLRTQVTQQGGAQIEDVAEFELALAHLRVPELV